MRLHRALRPISTRLKRLGCTDVISVSAAGRSAMKWPPGDFVNRGPVSIDRTLPREKVVLAPAASLMSAWHTPTCPRFGRRVRNRARGTPGINVHRAVLSGDGKARVRPRLAESKMYRESWGAKC